MANSISAEIVALRADIAEVLSYLRPPADLEEATEEAAKEQGDVPEEPATGVKFVDGQLVDVPKGKGK